MIFVHFKTVLPQGTQNSGPVLAPAEVLIAIHGIDPEKDGIPLKKVILSKPQLLCLFSAERKINKLI